MPREADRGSFFFLVTFTVGVSLARLWLAANLELAPDEAYYWRWSGDLSLTYLDHPPLVAWLVRIGTLIAGQTELGVRLHCVALSAAAVFIVYSLGLRAGLSGKLAVFAACLSTFLPAPATAGIIATPDTALGVCWLAAVSAMVGLSGERSGKSTRQWYVLGAALGVGLLAKHSALLIPLLVLVAAIGSAEIRGDLKTAHPWLAAGLAAAIALPYLAAEAKTGFMGFHFQADHLAGALDAETMGDGPLSAAKRLVELWGGQLGLLTPLVAIPVVIAFSKKRKRAFSFVLGASLLLPMAAASLAALFTHPEQNWASLGHPVAAIIAILGLMPKPRSCMILTLVSVLAITAVIHAHAVRPILPLPPDRDPTSRLHGWHGLESLATRAAGVDAIVCDNYGLAAETAWVLRDRLRDSTVGSSDRAFSGPPGRWLILDQADDWGGRKVEARCDAARSLDILELKRRDGQTVRKIAISIGQRCGK